MQVGGVGVFAVLGSCLAVATAWGLSRGRNDKAATVLLSIVVLILLFGVWL